MKDYITGFCGLVLSAFIYFSSENVVVADGGLAKNPAYYPRVLALILAILAFCLVVNALMRKENSACPQTKNF